MKNSKLLRLQLHETFDWLEQVVEDLTPEQYAWQPEGTANPISKLHAHTLSSADFWMNLMGLQKPMLWMNVSQKFGLPVQLDRNLGVGRHQPWRHAGVLARPARGLAGR